MTTSEPNFENTPLSVQMDSAAKAKLHRLAQHRRLEDSDLASIAIADYVDRELEIVDGIERGLADMRSGRVVSHDDAMARLRRTIARSDKR